MRRRVRCGVYVFGVAAILASACGDVPAAAQEGDEGAIEFVDVSTLPRSEPAGSMLFLPLDVSFGSCVPLTEPCPRDSSTVLLVPASNRRLAWTPEGSDLPTLELPDPRVPAVGSPPAAPASARFLVPVLDARGPSLVHLGRRASGRLLVDDDRDDVPGTDPSDEPFLPHLQGPALSMVAPARSVPDRLLTTPELVDAASLTDLTPVLVVRRAAPNRVVFGVVADPAWSLTPPYVPLIAPDALAFVARHGDDVGLAMHVPPETRLDPREEPAPDGPVDNDEDDEEGQSTNAGAIAAVVGAAAGATGTAAFLVARRRRGRRRS